jgi:sugar transferase (PEP-CTERM system associated)
MTRILGRYVSLEMAVLGLCEFTLSFLVIYAMLTAPGGLAVLVGAAPPDGTTTLAPDCIDLAAVLAFTIAAIAITIGLYRPEICLEARRLVINAAVAGVIAFPAILLVSDRFHIGLSRYTVLWLAAVLLGWLACILVTRLIFSRVMRERWFVRHVLVFGSGPRAARICALARAARGKPFEPVMVEADDCTALATAPLSNDRPRHHRVWGVIVTDELAGAGTAVLPPSSLLDPRLRGVPVFDEASFSEQFLGRIDLDSSDCDRLLEAGLPTSPWLANATKRGCDIVVSLALLLLTLPLMLATALLIRLDSPGPVLYRQLRVGLRGREFMLLKFRSMTVDAEAGGKPRWTTRQDPRITRIGRVVRPMRIDELPQLLNVLSGEMSLIGPRPERPHFVEQLTRVIPFYRERSLVKPGITGWAQVNFPYGASVEDAREKLAYDLYYVKNRGLLLDFLILLSTVRVILFREGAR